MMLSIPQWCDCCQSHNGAIAASFQSHNGAIAAHFNPTMVRLLQVCQQDFQSHNGAIAALRPIAQSHNGAIAANRCNIFNPTMVRLLLPQRRKAFIPRSIMRLSIPQWCDCCQGKILGFEGKRKGNGEGVAVDLRLPENP